MSDSIENRSWVPRRKIVIGDKASVQASYFEAPHSNFKYSSSLQFQENTLMEGVIIQVFLKTVRMKFLDNTICTIKKEDLVFNN